MKKLTLKSLKENGIELANYILRSFAINNHLHCYNGRPISAYVFYYEKNYIVYTYIDHSPRIQKYMTFKEAFTRLEEFIINMNK